MATGEPSNNLYITDLPAGCEQAQVQQIFELYGTVQSVKVLSKGPGIACHALVRFANQQEAEWIQANLDGNMPQGLSEPVGVRFAAPPKAAFAAGGAGPYGGGQAMGGGALGKGGFGAMGGCAAMGGAGGQESISTLIETLAAANAFPRPTEQHALYVANLPADTLNNDLRQLFSPFGAIPNDGVKSLLNPDGSCKGIGFVNFTEEVAAQTAVMTLNGTMTPWGKQLIVKVKDGGTGGGKGIMAPGMGMQGAMGGGGKGGGKKGGNYKSALCTLFASGNCTRPSCNFAHGEEELQPYGTWAPGTGPEQ